METTELAPPLNPMSMAELRATAASVLDAMAARALLLGDVERHTEDFADDAAAALQAAFAQHGLVLAFRGVV